MLVWEVCHVVTSNRAPGWFEGNAGMGSFVLLLLATEWLDGLRGVLVWEVCHVVTSNRAPGWFEGNAGMGSFVMLLLATEWLDGLRGVLVWEVVSRVLVTWHVLDKGFFCNLKHCAYKCTEKHLKIVMKLIVMPGKWSYDGFVNISCKGLGILINTT